MHNHAPTNYQCPICLAIEGIENEIEEHQRAFVMRQLSHYADEPLLKQLKTENWLDVFNAIYRYTEKGSWTIYFEEVQWLANYKDNFINQVIWQKVRVSKSQTVGFGSVHDVLFFYSKSKNFILPNRAIVKSFSKPRISGNEVY